MASLTRRDFLQAMGAAAAVGLVGCNRSDSLAAQQNRYELPLFGNTRILHMTDIHAQLKPIYFREPNINLGMGNSKNKSPHIVGRALLNELGYQPNTLEAYALTHLNFEQLAQQYGKMGGFAYLKTALDSLRESAGGIENTLTVDGGDLWQGSGSALWTRGMDMVEASNLLGVDVMVGHWEFTYKEAEVLSNLGFFKGDFLGQNVRIVQDALFDDNYLQMTQRYDGRGLYDEDEAMPFQPYVMKSVAGKRIAVIGQAFPRTANANPQQYFFPDWSFGLKEEEMAELVRDIRANDQPDAVILVSHNGMDVDLKMASRVSGIDAIFGGHTHDAVAKPVLVRNSSGSTLVTNAGCSGKFIGAMDFDIKGGKVVDYRYHLLPVVASLITPNREVESYIEQVRARTYDEHVVESRNPTMANNAQRLGKRYQDILEEKVCTTEHTLYRRGNFMGTWDQVLLNALREEYQADIAFSAGVRWGTSVPAGSDVRMEDILANTATTYAESYVTSMSGKDIKQTMEAVAENIFQPDPYLQSGGDMMRIGGLNYTINPYAKLGQRISGLKTDSGEALDLNKTYTVAGWGQVNTVGKGRLMCDVAADYLRRAQHLTLTHMNHPTVTGVHDNQGIADYQGRIV